MLKARRKLKIHNSFKLRILVTFLVLINAILFNISSSFFPRFVFGLIFLILAGLFVFLVLTRIIKLLFFNYRLLFKKNIEWKPLPKQYQELADRMNVKIKHFGIQKGLLNAYVRIDKKLIFGENLINKLDDESSLAVVAHEMGHIKSRTSITFLLKIFGLILYSIGIIMFQELPIPILIITTFAYIMPALILFIWHEEFQADKYARLYVGNDALNKALKVLEKLRMGKASETHPSTKSRLMRRISKNR
jgi:Zn-dependent protease with chaperone function